LPTPDAMGQRRAPSNSYMRLPLLVSLAHAGLDVPEEVRDNCLLSLKDIVRDGDEGAREIYGRLENICVSFHSTRIARAFVDMNRAEDDIRLDGVVKTHTIWNQPIYRNELSAETIQTLIRKYWRPYHEDLSRLSGQGAILGLDCHTMAATGPPLGHDAGIPRPAVCLSNADGTCPNQWIRSMAECFRKAFHDEVRINDPFSGGYIIRSHSGELPWVQIEISRGDFMSNEQKGACVLSALTEWAASLKP